MTFDPTKPVQTRDGRKARILCTDRIHVDGTIVALIGYPKDSAHEGQERILSYYSDGLYKPPTYRERFPLKAEDDNDLVNVPVKTSTWQPIYSSRISSAPPVCTGNCYTSRWAAEANSMLDAKGYLRRDYEDDEFVGIELEKV